jgi:hypothetical protein
MLVASRRTSDQQDNESRGTRAELWRNCGVRAELMDLLEVPTRVDHSAGVDHILPCRCWFTPHTRLEILAAFGIGDTAKVAPWQTGVYWAKDAADLFAFTLDKTTGQFSPTTATATTPSAATLPQPMATRADSETDGGKVNEALIIGHARRPGATIGRSGSRTGDVCEA